MDLDQPLGNLGASGTFYHIPKPQLQKVFLFSRPNHEFAATSRDQVSVGGEIELIFLRLRAYRGDGIKSRNSYEELIPLSTRSAPHRCQPDPSHRAEGAKHADEGFQSHAVHHPHRLQVKLHGHRPASVRDASAIQAFR